MAIDTAQKRMSAMDPDMPWRGVGVDATEGGFTVGNRQAAADLYSGIESGAGGGGPPAIIPLVGMIANPGTLLYRH
jgi:hypothetical protein